MVRIQSRYAGSFTVHSSDVKEICNLLESKVAPPKISAACSDDIERDFNSFDELASYGNPPSKAIMSLTISSSKSWEEQRLGAPIARASVDFRLNGVVSIAVEGQERDGEDLRNKLKDVVDGTKSWFTLITKNLNSVVATMIASMVFMLPTWFIFFYYVRGASTTDSAETSLLEVPFLTLVLVVIAACLVLSISLAMPYALGGLQSWLFPGTSFALGQGERRDQIKEKFRWVLVALIPATALSAVFFLVDKAM